MGKPSMSYVMLSICEYIAYQEGTPGELKHLEYPEEEKENSIPLSSKERNGKNPNQQACACWGCRTLYTELQRTTLDESSGKMNQKKVIIL